jgi:hypothetical protein
VAVRTGGKRLTQFHDGKSGYLSQSSLPLYFGLGDTIRVDELEILWPSGTRQVIANGIPIDQLMQITENPQ